jgi:hypothetical protein
VHSRSLFFFPAGNLFEGEWRDGKPVVKNGQGGNADGPMDWLNEAVATVASNIGIDGRDSRGDYQTVATHDEDDDYRGGGSWRR